MRDSTTTLCVLFPELFDRTASRAMAGASNVKRDRVPMVPGPSTWSPVACLPS